MGLRFGNITEIDVAKMYARVTFMDDGIVSAPLQILTMGAKENKFFHIFDINEQVACMMDDESVEGVILGAIFNNKTNPDGGNKDKVRVKFSDNSTIEYDRATHEYNIDIKGKINIKSDSEVNIETETANVTATTVAVDATVVNVDAETVNVDATNVDLQATNVTIQATTDIIGETTINGNLIVTGNVTAVNVVASTAITTPSISGPGVTMSGGNIDADGNIEAGAQVKGATVLAGTINLATHKHSGVLTGFANTGPAIP